MAEAKNERRQALELAISQIERQFGKGSVMRLGSGGPLEEIAVIPTGAITLDVALGDDLRIRLAHQLHHPVDGLPQERIREPEHPAVAHRAPHDRTLAELPLDLRNCEL